MQVWLVVGGDVRDVNEFSVGGVLGAGFSAYFQNLPIFIPLSLIAFAPSFAIGLLPEVNSLTVDPSTDVGLFILVSFRELAVDYVCMFWVQAGLTYGIVRHLRGGSADLLQTLWQSIRLLLPVILVALVVGVATLIGFMLLVVPGVIVSLMLWVAVPVAVVERRGLGAIRRSYALTDGYKGQLFGLALILGFLQIFTMTVVGVVANSLENVTVTFVVITLASIVMSGIWASVVAVTYHDLRVVKEGVDTQVIARVFD